MARKTQEEQEERMKKMQEEEEATKKKDEVEREKAEKEKEAGTQSGIGKGSDGLGEGVQASWFKEKWLADQVKRKAQEEHKTTAMQNARDIIRRTISEGEKTKRAWNPVASGSKAQDDRMEIIDEREEAEKEAGDGKNTKKKVTNSRKPSTADDRGTKRRATSEGIEFILYCG